MRRNETTGMGMEGGLLIVSLAVALALVAGWIMNIVKLAESDFSTITGLLVLRVIGVFLAPIGAVLGWI